MLSPEAAAVQDFLDRGRRRLRWLSAIEVGAASLFIASAIALLSWPTQRSIAATLALGLVPIMVGCALGIVLFQWRQINIARQVERRAPQCRNQIFTASELLDQRTGSPSVSGARASAYLTSLIYRDAAKVTASLELNALFPLRRAAIALTLSLVVLSAVAVRAAAPAVHLPVAGSDGTTIATIDGVEITVTPPAYAGRPKLTERDPSRIEVLAGSVLRVRVNAHATSMTLETVRGHQSLTASGKEPFTTDVVADADGYLSLEPKAADGKPGARRLIGLTVLADQAPTVRITQPGKDIRMKDGNQTLDLVVESGDDIGLASLTMKYTKVSGAGENFTFTEGEVPLTVTRGDPQHWSATAHWHLKPLELDAGDVVVYRAIAADHRPGAPVVESDAFIAEVIAPGGDAAAGFEVDPDMERYALSEQMIILKSERLVAARKSMAADSFADAAADIASEQRSVRAEFVFMMGGEIAADPTSMTMLNEEEEASGEGDLAAGYAKNQGREALLGAIRSMSRASTSLTDTLMTQALVNEHAALTQLERAFSHSRILLRALTEREKLDPTRRMTGDIVDAGRSSRPSFVPEAQPYLDGLRSLLGAVSSISAANASEGAANAALLAERVLRLDPSSKALQEIAVQIGDAAKALRAGHGDEARGLLDRAGTSLSALLRARLLNAPPSSAGDEASRLRSALTERARGGA